MGSYRDKTLTLLFLKWCKIVNAVGVHFSYDKEESLQKTIYDKITDIKKQIPLWSCRGLSLLGKLSVIKSPFLPKLIFIVFGPPNSFGIYFVDTNDHL